MGLNQTEQEKLGKEMERDGQRKDGRVAPGRHVFHPPHNHQSSLEHSLYISISSDSVQPVVGM